MICHQCVAEPVPLASNLQPFGACTQVPTSDRWAAPSRRPAPKPIDRRPPLTHWPRASSVPEIEIRGQVLTTKLKIGSDVSLLDLEIGTPPRKQ